MNVRTIVLALGAMIVVVGSLLASSGCGDDGRNDRVSVEALAESFTKQPVPSTASRLPATRSGFFSRALSFLFPKAVAQGDPCPIDVTDVLACLFVDAEGFEPTSVCAPFDPDTCGTRVSSFLPRDGDSVLFLYCQDLDQDGECGPGDPTAALDDVADYAGGLRGETGDQRACRDDAYQIFGGFADFRIRRGGATSVIRSRSGCDRSTPEPTTVPTEGPATPTSGPGATTPTPVPPTPTSGAGAPTATATATSTVATATPVPATATPEPCENDPICLSNADCCTNDGFVCEQGQCVIDAAPTPGACEEPPFCTANVSDCCPGSICRSGQCQTPTPAPGTPTPTPEECTNPSLCVTSGQCCPGFQCNPASSPPCVPE